MLGRGGGRRVRERVPPERLGRAGLGARVRRPRGAGEARLWVAEDYCSTPARGLALVLPPGTGTVAPAAPAARYSRAAGRRADCRRQRGARRAARRSAGRGSAQTLECAAEGRRRQPSSRTRGCDHSTLRRLADALDCFRSSAGRSAGTSPASSWAAWRAEAGADQPDAHARAGAALEAVLAGSAPSPRAAAAERGHGQWQDRGLPARRRGRRSSRDARRSCWSPRSRSPRRLRGASRERFGDRVAVLHSQLGLGERYDEWQRLRRGEARVCVGPRSAVFAPLRDLGLIVVDEEHDSAYKQESDPRYDARRVAERRAEQAPAVLLCGSATPRPESWLRMRRLDLPERVGRRGLPPVELIDMRGAAPRLSSLHARGARRREARGRQGDRAGQPAGLVAVRRLPLTAAGPGCARAAT